MIRITPENLAFAERLSKIRRSPKPSDGAKSWPRCHQLVYNGGNKLTFRTSDLRISLVSELPVEGEDDPWDCRVYQDNFDTHAKYEEGGRFTLNATPASCVQVGKGVSAAPRNVEVTPPSPDAENAQILPRLEDTPTLPFGDAAPTVTVDSPPTADGPPTELSYDPRYRYPYRRVPVETPFPDMLVLDPDHLGMPISLDKLRRALRFLAASRKERDPNCRLNVCSIMPNQQVGTWNDGVFIQTDGPIVNAPINLASADAFRLAEWLQLLHSRKEEQLQIARTADGRGRTTVLFATPGMEHRFQVLGMPRPFPTEFFTNLRALETTIGGTVSRQELRMAAGCFSQFINCNLHFHFKKDGDRWKLTLTPTREVPRSGGPIAISVQQAPADVEEIPPFLVSAVQLLTAVEYYTCQDLHFTLRQRAKVLTLADTPEGDEKGGEGANQTHVGVRFNVIDE
jgi:hypothetical protein